MSGTAMVLLEPQKHLRAQVCMLCSLGFFCFAIKNGSICFNCFPLSNHYTDFRRGELEFLHGVNLLTFQT